MSIRNSYTAHLAHPPLVWWSQKTYTQKKCIFGIFRGGVHFRAVHCWQPHSLARGGLLLRVISVSVRVVFGVFLEGVHLRAVHYRQPHSLARGASSPCDFSECPFSFRCIFRGVCTFELFIAGSLTVLQGELPFRVTLVSVRVVFGVFFEGVHLRAVHCRQPHSLARRGSPPEVFGASSQDVYCRAVHYISPRAFLPHDSSEWP